MASFGPGFSAAPDSLSAEINSSSTNDENDFNNSDPLHLLSQGIEQTIRIDRRMMLEKTMECLGARVATTFSVIETADAGVKVSIKLDVSRLPTVSGQRIRLSVVEGDSFLDPAGAEFSAVMKAFNHLEKNHLVRMVDFSSRVARSLGLESSNTFVLFNQANSCLKKVFEQWVLAFGKFENFAGSHESKESPDPFSGAPTDGAKVCGLLSDYLSSLHSTLRDKLDDIRSQMEDIELYRRHYIRKIAKRGQLYSSNGNMHEVQFTSKDTLNYVLSFYGIDFAEYTDCPKPDGLVESTVGFEFPYMPNFKFAGNIRISGMAYTSHDADEEAAYKALLFIENNFITKVADFNYIQPQKALKLHNRLTSLMSKAHDVADSLKMIFGELISAIEGKRRQFSFDPAICFAGHMAPGLIDAYHFCFNGLKEVDQYAAKCFASCGPDFAVLDKLTWDLISAQNNAVPH